MSLRSSLIAATVAAGVIWSTPAVIPLDAAPGRIRIKLATLAPKDSSYHRTLLEMGEKWRADVRVKVHREVS